MGLAGQKRGTCGGENSRGRRREGPSYRKKRKEQTILRDGLGGEKKELNGEMRRKKQRSEEGPGGLLKCTMEKKRKDALTTQDKEPVRYRERGPGERGDRTRFRREKKATSRGKKAARRKNGKKEREIGGERGRTD